MKSIFLNKGIYNNIDIMENTIDSFNKAFSAGFSIKTKCQILKDNTFVILEDDALERIFNLKDDIKSINFEDIEYISKYKILKLEELLKIINDNIILEFNNTQKKVLKQLLKLFNGYEKKILIASTNIKTLKYFRKKDFQVILKVNKNNKLLVDSYFKPDGFLIEYNLFEQKIIKKLRESCKVFGYIKEKKLYSEKIQNDFDAIIVDL